MSAISESIEQAVNQVLSGDKLTYDLGGSAGTSEVGDLVCQILEENLRKHIPIA